MKHAHPIPASGVFDRADKHWCPNCAQMCGTYSGGRCDGCDTVIDHEAAADLDEAEIAEAFSVDNWRPRIVVDLTR